MKDFRRKVLVGAAVSLVALAGLFALTLHASNPQGDTKQYKRVIGGIQSSRRVLGSGGDPSGSLRNVQSHYIRLVSQENFENGSNMELLDNRIVLSISRLSAVGENAGEENISLLKDRVSVMADRLGVGLPIGLEYAAFVVLGFGLFLAFIANVLCVRLTDWESLKEAEEAVEEWRKKLVGSQKKRGKKGRKKEVEREEMTEARERIWMINAKQSFFYLALFFPFLAWLGFVYGGWTVTWLPFDWFATGALGNIGVSLGFFGWFGLAYFGFAYIWRRILLSEKV